LIAKPELGKLTRIPNVESKLMFCVDPHRSTDSTENKSLGCSIYKPSLKDRHIESPFNLNADSIAVKILDLIYLQNEAEY